MFKIILMLSNYFHDLATAMLASNILVVYFLSKFLDNHPQKVDFIGPVFAKLKIVTYIALGWVLLGGIPRAIYFMDFEWNPAVGKGQVAALIVKHILLISITVFGIIVHRKYLKKYESKA